MKCMLILLACIVAIQAHGHRAGVLGPGGYSSGGVYTNEGRGAGYGGSHHSGYYAGGEGAGHNIGRVVDDVHHESSHHHAEDHNIGGGVRYGSGGHRDGAYRGYDHGHLNRGGGYRSRHPIIVN